MIKKRPATAREVAAFTLFSMEEDGAWSDGALDYYLSRAVLSTRDTALATRLCYGVLQNRAMLDFYLSQYSSVRLKKISPRVLNCLRMGIYQMTMMERVPPHAAVGESIVLIEKYGHANTRTISFANGLLRAISRAGEAGDLPVLNCASKEEYYALRYSHPAWLVQKWSRELGQKETGLLCSANNAQAPLSLRVNLMKISREEAMEELREVGFVPCAHEMIPNIVLCEGGDIARCSLFSSGAVTVQDGAGVACVDVLEPQPGMTVLDCCAAPGGKSFYIAECMGNIGKVISCDIYTHKLDRITEGATRLGLSCIQTCLADATVIQQNLLKSADCVLCDVPCSGLGIIRKKPEIRYKPEKSIAGLPELQLAILENCSNYVKLGGVLVYSTCTVLQRENQEVVAAFLMAHPEFERSPFTHSVCGEQMDGMVTLLPNVHQTDGFFIAKLRRKHD